MSTAFPYFVQLSSCITISLYCFLFYARSKAKGLGGLNQTPYFSTFLNSLFLKKCKSILMFWIPHATNNRASMFELIKTLLSSKTTLNTLVPGVFLDFSSRKRSRASREAATTSHESDEEREKNLWLPWPRISLSCRRQLSYASNC